MTSDLFKAAESPAWQKIINLRLSLKYFIVGLFLNTFSEMYMAYFY